MTRVAHFAYGVFCYAVFFGTFLYTAGFLLNLWVPKSIDSGSFGVLDAGFASPSGSLFGIALAINLGLLTLFAVQHSGMARPGWKRAWTRIIPEPIERATYVLFSSLVLIATMAFWQPMAGSIWHFESGSGQAIGYALFGLGLATVLYSTMLIDHFELFGLKQVWRPLVGRAVAQDDFKTPSLYRYVRHPLYLGWFISLWATPSMSMGHLIFSAVCTIYILMAVQLEERDLVDVFGRRYRDYQDSTPMFFPRTRKSATTQGARKSDGKFAPAA